MKISLIILIILLFSCSSINKKDNLNFQCRIRYVNIEAVYVFFLNKNPESNIIIKQKTDLVHDIKKMRSMKTGDISSTLKNKFKAMENIERQIEQIKSGILKKINRALKITAKEFNADIILNSSNQVLYGNDNLDITEEVIREIIRTDKRSAPVSR